MRLLLINPNTSEHVTQRMLAQAQRACGAEAEVRAVTATFGPAIIGSRTENAIAGHAAVELAARHAEGFDAVILGVSMDTALHALRELLDVPVVGMTEAALFVGCMTGGRVGCLTLGRRLLPMYEELTQSYGLAARVACWDALDLPAAYGTDVDPDAAQQVTAACRRMAADHGADVVALCGAVLTGYASRIGPALDFPVIDCIDAAARQAMALAALHLPRHRSGSYARPVGRRLEGVDAALARLLK